MSQITEIKERTHSFSVQTASQDRTIFLSCNTEEESNEWRKAIIAASVRRKVHKAEAIFNNRGLGKSDVSLIKKPFVGTQDEDFLNDDSNFYDIKPFNRHTVGGGAGGSTFAGNANMSNTFHNSPFKVLLVRLADSPEERMSPREDT